MTVVTILSSFPPTQCGIGYYARSQTRALQAEGHTVYEVDVAPLNESGWKGRSLNAFQTLLRFSDKVVIHFQGSLFYEKNGIPGVRSIRPFVALDRVLDGKEVEIVVHENYYPFPRGLDWTPLGWVQESYVSALFKRAKTVYFHTAHEALRCRLDIEHKARLLDPAKFYKPNALVTKSAAREKLGLGEGKVFFCAGFYHPGKGFERLIDAFENVESGNLFIFTSDREKKFGTQVADLRARPRNPRTRVEVGFLSDEDYDTWLAAADFVVIPYTYGFTSGLMGRASVYGTPCIYSQSLAGLAEQAGSEDIGFWTDEELHKILEDCSC